MTLSKFALNTVYIPTNVNATRATLIKVDLAKIRTFQMQAVWLKRMLTLNDCILTDVFYGYCTQTPY